MNKSLFFLLSLICLPCFGNQIDLLITLTTSDNQTRSVIGSYDSATKRVTAPYSHIDPIASLLLSGEENLIVDSQMKATDGEFVAVKKLGVEIPVLVDAAAFDHIQEIMRSDNYNLANLDQPNTVKMINTNTSLGGPQAVTYLLLNHCVDLFIAHPEQRCPFGTTDRGDNSDDPSLFIKKTDLIEAARNILYNRFKTNALPSKTAVILTHNKNVVSACYSPDGQQILTLCDDGNVRIWNINGTLLQTLVSPTGARWVAYSPNSQQVLTTGYYDPSAYLWDTNGTLLQTLHHPARVESATFSPDGHQILTACLGHSAYLWDTNGTLLQSLVHPTYVYYASYSPNGHQIITSSYDHKVRIWDINGTLLQTLVHPNNVQQAAYSPDGHQIITTCYDREARIWDINGTMVQALEHPMSVTGVIYSPDGQQVVTVCADHNVRIWDTNGTLSQTLVHPQSVAGVTYSPDGQQILTTCADCNVRIWGINGTQLQTLVHPTNIRQPVYSPNGQQVYTSDTHNVYIWDINGTVLQTLGHPTNIRQTAYSPDGQQVLSVCGNRKVHLRQIAFAPQFGSILDVSETELRRLAFMTRVAINPHFTAQEIADMQPVYHALPTDQRARVDRQTRNTFARV